MPKLDDDIDALFKLPLTEFVGARKALAARLKQNGLVSEAEGVKALAKPSISAWTVNQLYWRHREAFDELIATGQRFHKAQTSGKMVNMREALDARREALSHLSDLATEALSDAGHNPLLDTLRRISTTLEALSVATSLSDRPLLLVPQSRVWRARRKRPKQQRRKPRRPSARQKSASKKRAPSPRMQPCARKASP